jgi:WD40 repeat protein
MMKPVLFCSTVLLLQSVTTADDVSFRRDVAPILAVRCLGCHNSRTAEGRYALHTFERLMKPGDSDVPVIIPGNPDESYFLERLIETDPDSRMPQQDSALDTNQIALIRQWIRQGAVFDGADPSSRILTLLPPRRHPAAPEIYRVSIPVFALAFSPDGKSLMTGGWHELLLWDVITGKLQNRVNGMPQRIHSVAFSPDGQTVAVCGGSPGEYGEIQLFAAPGVAATELGSVLKRRVITGWEDVILDACFSPDGRRLVASGADNSVRCYDSFTGTEIWQTRQHVDWVTGVDITSYKFSEENVANDPENKLFVFNEHEQKSGEHVRQCWDFGNDHFIIREANWELEMLPAADSDSTPTESLTRITVTGIGKTYNVQRESYSGSDIEPDAAVGGYLKSLYESWGQNADGSRLVVSSSRDRTVKVFSLTDGMLFTTYKGHRREYGPLKGLHRVFGVQAEPATRRVWSGGEGKHFHGWNPVTVRDEDGTAADMEERFSKEYSTDLIRHEFTGPVFSLIHCGNQLVGGAADGKINSYVISGPDAAFSVNDVAATDSYAGQSDHIFAVAASATGQIAAVGFRGEVVIWDAETCEITTRFTAAPLKK